MNFVNLVITDVFIQKTAFHLLFYTKKGMIHITSFYRQPDQAGHEAYTEAYSAVLSN